MFEIGLQVNPKREGVASDMHMKILQFRHKNKELAVALEKQGVNQDSVRLSGIQRMGENKTING